MEKSRVDNAEVLHQAGMNCAQAVVCNYCDMFGVDKKIAFQMAEAFGAGMGSMEYTCGAVSGLLMLLGLKNSSGTPEKLTKAATYKLGKELINKFKEKNGSVICAELKGLKTNKVLRSCNGCIADACKIFEELLKEEVTV